MKMGVLVSTNDPETGWNAFRFANTAREVGHDVQVFLMGKGVELAVLKHPSFDVGKQIHRFSGKGGKVLACGTCLDLRKQGTANLCDVSTMNTLVELVGSVDRLVSFG